MTVWLHTQGRCNYRAIALSDKSYQRFTAKGFTSYNKLLDRHEITAPTQRAFNALLKG